MQRRFFAPLLLALALGAAGCLGDTSGPSPIALEDDTFHADLEVDLKQMTKAQSGLYYQDLTVGEGETVVAGDRIKAHYIGRLTNGTQFDKSGNDPITLSLLPDSVIAGWVYGIPGMKVGGKRKLVLPSSLAYGPYSIGQIPPYANLVFDVELVSIVVPDPE